MLNRLSISLWDVGIEAFEEFEEVDGEAGAVGEDLAEIFDSSDLKVNTYD